MDTIGLETLLQQRGGGIVNLRFDNGRWQAQVVLAASETEGSVTMAGSGETLTESLQMALGTSVTPGGGAV